MKVLIITGGNSSERKVSLTSAKNVRKVLIENGHNAQLYDLRGGYKKINEIALKFDILFPVLHGEEGEGGKLHKFLSQIDRPIVGTRNYKGFEKGWYKIPFKKYCDKNKIPTPLWKTIHSIEDITNFGFPCVLKTSNGGSSKEVVIIKDKSDLKKKDVKRIFNLKTPIFLEEFLSGKEITVGILNNKSLPVIEIIPPNGESFDYKNKYSGETQEIPFAPNVSKKIQDEASKITLKIHKFFNLGSYSRTDFMIYRDIPYAVDVNTIPGLTSESLMPKAVKASGISFNEFLEILLKNAQ